MSELAAGTFTDDIAKELEKVALEVASTYKK
jgi:hypothetical protein